MLIRSVWTRTDRTRVVMVRTLAFQSVVGATERVDELTSSPVAMSELPPLLQKLQKRPEHFKTFDEEDVGKR